MAYFINPSDPDAHQHANKEVLDAIQDPGSGQVITEPERLALANPFSPPPESAIIWDGNDPSTIHDALAQLSVFVATRCKLKSNP